MKSFIKRASKALKLLLTNPLGLWRRLKPLIMKAQSGVIKINGINFNIDLELDPIMRYMFFGAYEPDVTDLLKKYLKEGDTFIDVGSNVGYITAFSLGLVGKSGEVHSFEPVPQYMKKLQNIQKDNPDYNIHLNNVALGEDEGTALISVNGAKNIGWNTMVPDFMEDASIKEKVEITVTTLDKYLSQNNIQQLDFIKIDTEGYEYPVMKGFQKYLRSATKLPVILIEIAPNAYSKLGLSLSDFSNLMKHLGYTAQRVELASFIDITELKETTDVVFLPKTSNTLTVN